MKLENIDYKPLSGFIDIKIMQYRFGFRELPKINYFRLNSMYNVFLLSI